MVAWAVTAIQGALLIAEGVAALVIAVVAILQTVQVIKDLLRKFK